MNRPPLLPIASPLIPVRFGKIALGANAEEIGRKLHETALAADYGKVERVQFIGDGAPWMENIAKDGFKAAIFTLDCSHAFGYVNKVCEFPARDAKESKKVFRKVKDRMYGHDFDRAEKYLRNKYKAHFTEDGLKHWSEEASKAWRYLDERRKYMNYGWLRRHGYLIGSGHIESACKVEALRAGVRDWAIGNREGIVRLCRLGRMRNVEQKRRKNRPSLLPIA